LVKEAHLLRDQGLTLRKTAEAMSVSHPTVHRPLRA
jgi:orotate phosphoribosyltransferase-like protein